MAGRRRRWRTLILFLAFAALAYGAVRVKRATLVDFAVYHRAAGRVLDAEPLYQPGDGHYQFKYLPAFALAMAPFGLLDAETASAIWFTVSAALLVVFFSGSVRALPDRRLSEPMLIAIGGVLLAKCFVLELTYGQTNLLFGVVLLSAWRAAAAGHDAIAGVLVAAAVVVKPYAIVLVPWLIAARGRRAGASTTVALAAGLLLPAAIYGWDGNLALAVEWFRTVTATSATLLTTPENVSIPAMWARWLGPGAAAAWCTAITVAALAIVMVAAWVRRERSARADYLVFGLILLIIPLASPQGWDYVLLLGAPVVFCVVDRWGELPPAWRLVSAASLAVIGFTVFDIVGREAYAWMRQASVITVAAILLMASAARLRWLRLA